MSQGAVFRLVLRDERFDNLFTASAYLRGRIQDITKERAARGAKENSQRAERGLPPKPVNPLPTFVDIARSHILFLRAVYKPFVAVACEYVRVRPVAGGSVNLDQGGSSLAFTFPIYGHFTSDMVFHVQVIAFGDFDGTQNREYRYCAFPGLRLFRRTAFLSDQMLIDDYTSDDAAFFSKFHVDKDHQTGWLRGVGQQDVRVAEYDANTNVTGCFMYKDGPQTFKAVQPRLDMWVPAQFWMCRDAGNALLNDLIPNTQRTITVELEALNKIIQAREGTTLVDIDERSPAGVINIDLYVNNIFVNPEIHDIFTSRIGFSLTRVHRRMLRSLNKTTDTIRLDEMKYPAEYIHFGFRDKQNANDFDHWYLMGRNTRPSVPGSNALLVPVMVFGPAAPPSIPVGVCQLVCRTAKISATDTLAPIVDRIKVTAHGVTVFPDVPASFYTNYLPNRYPDGTLIVSPHDAAAYVILFCLYPGLFNPSGYYNLSTGRELAIHYSNASISTTQPAEFVASMSALNFIIRQGDKVRLLFNL